MPRQTQTVDVRGVGETDIVLRQIDAQDGLTVAYKFGKTGAREVTFTGMGVRALLLRSARDPQHAEGWAIVTETGRLIGYFGLFEVIGVWATGRARTQTTEETG